MAWARRVPVPELTCLPGTHGWRAFAIKSVMLRLLVPVTMCGSWPWYQRAPSAVAATIPATSCLMRLAAPCTSMPDRCRRRAAHNLGNRSHWCMASGRGQCDMTGGPGPADWLSCVHTWRTSVSRLETVLASANRAVTAQRCVCLGFCLRFVANYSSGSVSVTHAAGTGSLQQTVAHGGTSHCHQCVLHPSLVRVSVALVVVGARACAPIVCAY